MVCPCWDWSKLNGGLAWDDGKDARVTIFISWRSGVDGVWDIWPDRSLDDRGMSNERGTKPRATRKKRIDLL